jgi:hypothetical protein
MAPGLGTQQGFLATPVTKMTTQRTRGIVALGEIKEEEGKLTGPCPN